MLNYVNNIFCAYNSKDKSVVIQFNQEIPDQTKENTPLSTQTSEVTSVVMTKELAVKFMALLEKVVPSEG